MISHARQQYQYEVDDRRRMALAVWVLSGVAVDCGPVHVVVGIGGWIYPKVAGGADDRVVVWREAAVVVEVEVEKVTSCCIARN
jgi:hypothetical protein